MSPQFVTACAPGKLIVMGEHAVVSGAPAMALALKQYTHARIDRNSCHHSIWLKSSFSSERTSWGPYNLKSESFLEAPLEWAKEMLRRMMPSTFQEGLEWDLYSDIEPGHGMGSSAAAISSSFVALATLFEKSWTKEEVWPLLTQIESICHGKSSGIDIAVSLQGGALRFQDGKFEAMELPDVSSWYFYDSGKPLETTKACVLHSQLRFKEEPTLLEEMKSLSEFFTKYACKLSYDELSHQVRLWNQLQNRLGVVPKSARHFIEKIEKLGASAKVCGAGALSGDGAGLILVIASPEISQYLRDEGINLKPVEVDDAGARVTLLG